MQSLINLMIEEYLIYRFFLIVFLLFIFKETIAILKVFEFINEFVVYFCPPVNPLDIYFTEVKYIIH